MNEGRRKNSESLMEVRPMILRTPRRLDICSFFSRICCSRVVSLPDLLWANASSSRDFGTKVSMSVIFQKLNSHWMLTICWVSYLSASSPESSHPNICSIGFIFSTMNCLSRKRGWTEQVSTITEPYSFALHFSPYVHMFKNCNWRFIDISWLFSVTQVILHSC